MTQMSSPEALSSVAQALEQAERVLICAHVSPDPDALGSTLALGQMLERAGKQVIMMNDDPVPPDLRFLPSHNKVVRAIPEGFEPQLFVSLDCGDVERLGTLAEVLKETTIPLVNIDHHITNTGFGTHNLVIPESASTAEVLMLVFDEIGLTLDDDVATCLMTGFVGDTINFSTSSVTSQTFQLAARLREYDVNVTYINEVLFNQRSLDQLRIWGIGIENTYFLDGVIWAVVPYKAQKAQSVTETSLNRLSSFLISVREANVAATFREDKDGSIRMSMRAKPGFDVATVALELGGGGHTLAAGATASGPLKDVVKQTVKLLQKQSELGQRE